MIVSSILNRRRPEGGPATTITTCAKFRLKTTMVDGRDSGNVRKWSFSDENFG